MPRYKLRPPALGDFLYDHYANGPDAVVADTVEQARSMWEEYFGELTTPYFHSSIGVCSILYKADIDNDDAWEGASPGDTTVNYRTDDGRDLRDHEIRVWMPGAPPVSWRMEPLPFEPVHPPDVPVGTTIYHKRLGSGRTVGPGYAIGKWWYIDVDFGWPDPQFRRSCKLATIHLQASFNWPVRKFRLTVCDEFVAEGTEEGMQTLLAARISRLDAEWEATQE